MALYVIFPEQTVLKKNINSEFIHQFPQAQTAH